LAPPFPEKQGSAQRLHEREQIRISCHIDPKQLPCQGCTDEFFVEAVGPSAILPDSLTGEMVTATPTGWKFTKGLLLGVQEGDPSQHLPQRWQVDIGPVMIFPDATGQQAEPNYERRKHYRRGPALP
jgi:hypothetical protein